MAEGDTVFYSNGMLILNKVVKNPDNDRYHFKPTDAALMADITLVSKEGMHYPARPLIQVEGEGLKQVDDTVYAQNMFLRFEGVTDSMKVKIGVKESDKIIDFVTLKAYIFPYINLVWSGLIIMAIGLIMSAIRRAKLSTVYAAVILVAAGAALFYMFLLANN
jgi:cytochrome c-type biogenesis protein CcmF